MAPVMSIVSLKTVVEKDLLTIIIMLRRIGLVCGADFLGVCLSSANTFVFSIW